LLKLAQETSEMSNFAFFQFIDSPKQDLADLLPNLPTDSDRRAAFLKLMDGLLQPSASQRTIAWDALRDEWTGATGGKGSQAWEAWMRSSGSTLFK
jgi:hypothetical protein